MSEELIKKYSHESVVTKNKMGSMVVTMSEISKQFIADACKLPSDEIVVDVGCCYGVASLPILENGVCHVIGMDLSDEHLDRLVSDISQSDKDRFQSVVGRFPQDFSFSHQQLSIIHASHLLQFLTGEQMLEGFKKCYDCLKPGGKVYFSTTSIYLSWTEKFLPEYYERVEQGHAWPGEINNFLDYVPDFAKDRHSDFIHLLTKERLIALLEAQGFIIEQAFYYDLEQPDNKAGDEKELIGVIARK